jgi:hypothetical protein
VYKIGDYFGEVGLIHKIPRQASVMATVLFFIKKKSLMSR